MHDLVIRGGIVVDGTGEPRREADVAIDGKNISAVGGDIGSGRREIDARGLMVTPGFVDIHTHYDGQATWDPFLTPSTWHGVTTVVMGNCGVGFAPVRPGASPALINLMEGIEDIPGTVLSEGVKFDWQSFPDYLDVLDRAPKAIDIGAQMPHAALRFFAMGDRGLDHAAAPTDDEIACMGELLEEALKAGAMGFTTSRTIKHRAQDGRPTPSLSAKERELFGLVAAMKRAGRGVIEVNSDFGPGEFDILQAAAAASGRPLSLLLLQVNNAPELWRETRRPHPRCTCRRRRCHRPGGQPADRRDVGPGDEQSPVLDPSGLARAGHLTPAQRYDRLMRDPELRRVLVEERPDDEHTRMIEAALPRTYALDDSVRLRDRKPTTASRATAARAGVSPWALALETMMADGGKRLLTHTFENYT